MLNYAREAASEQYSLRALTRLLNREQFGSSSRQPRDGSKNLVIEEEGGSYKYIFGLMCYRLKMYGLYGIVSPPITAAV